VPVSVAVSTPLGEPPVFVTVTVVGALNVVAGVVAKSIDDGDGLRTAGDGESTAPFSSADAVTPLPATVSNALLAPAVVGEKLTWSTQLPPGGSAPGVHVPPTTENAPASAPEMASDNEADDAPPVFRTVTETTLVALTAVAGNEIGVGVMLRTGA
jgi:hypothetical protein